MRGPFLVLTCVAATAVLGTAAWWFGAWNDPDRPDSGKDHGSGFAPGPAAAGGVTDSAPERTQAAPDPAPVAGGLQIAVVDERGRPVAAAHVEVLDHLQPQEELPRGAGRWLRASRTEATTDSDGIATVASPDPGARGILVLAAGFAPGFVERDPADVRAGVTIERLVARAGLVSLDGEPPGAEIALSADVIVDRELLWTDVVRSRVRERRGADRLTVTADARGVFELRCPQAAASLVVSAPARYERAGGGAPVFHFEPGDALVVALSSAPRIDVVPVPAGADAVPATVELEVVSHMAGGSSESTRLATKMSAPVTVPWRADVRRFEVSVRDPADGRRLARHEEAGPFDDGRTITVLVPEPRRQVTVRVRDARGDPIPGAVVVAGDDRWEAASDSTCVFELPVRIRRLVVGAAGFAARSVELPADPPFELVVTLEFAGSIEITLVGAASQIDGLGVHVAPRSAPWLAERVHGAPPAEPDAEGRWRADTLPAGVPIRFSLTDRLGCELHSELVTLPAGVTQRREWRIGRAPRDVTVRVEDSAGTPLPGAAVRPLHARLWDLGPESHAADEAGVAVLERIFDPEPLVEIGHPGYVRFRGRLPRGDAHTVQLEPARTLLVKVTDAAGRPLLQDLELTFAGGGGTARRVAPGRYRFDAAPRRSGLVVCNEPRAQVRVAADADFAVLAVSQ